MRVLHRTRAAGKELGIDKGSGTGQAGTEVGTGDEDGTVSIKGGCVQGLSWEGAAHIWTKRAVVGDSGRGGKVGG